MRPASLVLAALALSGCAALSRPTAEDLQRGYARALRPAAVRASSAEAPPVARTFRLRAYADADYRGHAPDWQERIAAQVRGASAIVEREFGVELALEAIRPWERSGGTAGLADALDALASLDPAHEVAWVLGFVGPVPPDRDGEHELIGKAVLFGRHFVLRAMQSAAEVAEIGASWDELTEEEHRAMASAWRVHREVTTFLHEWGHTLGAVHECDDKWIMAPTYSLLTAAFSPQSARLVRVGLEHHELPDGERAARLEPAWRAEAARLQGAAWDCEKLERGLARAGEVLTGETRRAAGRAYATMVRKAVMARWKLPPDAFTADPKRVRFDIRIDAKGALKDVQLRPGSGSARLDESALEAVRAAQPFAAPPADVVATQGEAVVRLTIILREAETPASRGE